MSTNRRQITTDAIKRGLALFVSGSCAFGVITGCQITERFTADPLALSAEASGDAVRTLKPVDFIADGPTVRAMAMGAGNSGGNSQAPEWGTAEIGNTNPQIDLDGIPAPPPRVEYVAGAEPGVTVTVAGLVGQVNGRPIYVDDVFAPIADQLALMSHEMTYDEFAEKALRVISMRVRQMVENELLLAEAMGQLTTPQQEGLLNFLRNFEAGLIRGGGGSAQRANRQLLETKGVTLDERMAEVREAILKDEQYRTAIRAKITVTWRDVERYYREHPAEFNPTASIQLRVLAILKENAEKQPDIEAALAAGYPFELAIEDHADLMVGIGGLMGSIELPDGLAEARLTIWPRVDAAAKTLAVGVPAGPFVEDEHIVWIQIENYEDGAPIPLRDAQKDIENKLWSQFEAEETAKYFRKLLSRGNFDDLEVMASNLLAVALDRWAPVD